jgi:hypothetical protein
MTIIRASNVLGGFGGAGAMRLPGLSVPGGPFARGGVVGCATRPL